MITRRDSNSLARPSRVVELLEQIASDVGAVRVALEGRREPARDRLLGAVEVARLLGIDVRTLRELRHANAAPRSVTVGRSPKWRASEIDRWLESRP